MSEAEAVEGEVVNQSIGVQLTKHDESTVRLLEAALNYDFSITEACQYAGISRTTYYDWLADDDIFSYRMSVAQSMPKRMAKEIVVKAIQKGDSALALRYLMLRDPDFKPKAEVTNDPEQLETRQKIKDFLDDNTDVNDRGGQPTTADSPGAGSEVAQTPSDIS